MSQNRIEKIVQRYAVGLQPDQLVHSGDFVTIRPAHVLTHDNTGAVMPKFRAIGATQMADPRQPVFTLDHNVQNRETKNLAKYAAIEEFAMTMGVDFYPAGRGIGHQVMCEEGYVWPGTLVVASDSHANMYGGLGALGTPVVRSDAAALWATGTTWWQIPPVARVILTGALRPGVTGKDIILALCGHYNHDEVLNHALEFGGEGVASLSIDDRLTIANMTTEWGALAGVFATDVRTQDWFKARLESHSGHTRITAERLWEMGEAPVCADADADYARVITLALESVTPALAGPDTVKHTETLASAEQKAIPIHKAYLVSCVNSRASDLAAAARAVAGRNVAPGVEFYVAAASAEVQAESEQRGDWQKLLAAGAIPLPPGCGPCIGLGAGLLKDDEVGISATNRNFKGRMGSKSARAYLASPAVVAASAVAGHIVSPGTGYSGDLVTDHRELPAPIPPDTRVPILEGFPATLTGEVLFCPGDNLNTDGIYPGKYTYIDDFTPEQQAAVVMENYDPKFAALVREGDILVGCLNFGTGSSREQAATALKYRGVRLVIAASFSETFKRNAINNGFLVIRQPEFAALLKAEFGSEALTLRTDSAVTVNFAQSRLEFDGRHFPIDPVGTTAQALIIVGGLENWVRQQMNNE